MTCAHTDARQHAGQILKTDPADCLALTQALLEDLPCGAPDCAADLCLLAADAALRCGERDLSSAFLEQVTPTTAGGHVRSLLLRAQLAQGSGQVTQAAVYVQRAAQAARDAGLRGEEGDALSLLAQMQHRAGKSNEALHLLARVLTLRQADGNVDAEIRALCDQVVILNSQGRLRESLELLDAAQRRLPDCTDPLESALLVHANLGVLHEQAGQYGAAHAQFTQALDVAQRAGNQPESITMALKAGGMAHKLGHLDEAAELLTVALEGAREMGSTNEQSTALQTLGMILAAQGRGPEAAEAFQEAESLAEASGDVDRQLEILLGRATHHLDHQQPTLAGAPLKRALMLAEQAERTREMLQAHELLAQLYEDDAPREAIAHLKSAAHLSDQLRDVVLAQQARELTTQAELSSARRAVWHERQLRLASEQARTDAIAALDRERFYDDLTGLPNRLLMRVLLSQVAEQTTRGGQGVSVAILDIHRFKQVNDALGPAGGDELLRAVAGRLKAGLTKGEVLARTGSNEFVVLLLGETLEMRERRAATLLAALRENFRVHGLPVSVQGSLGIAHHPHDGTDPDELLRAAHIALDDAREQGHALARYQGGGEERQATLHFEAALADALNQGEFDLHYQPITDAASGLVRGAEALLRWHNPELGFRSPAEFIPVLERTGLIVPVGAWVLHEACRRASTWGGVPVAVNLSARQFQQGDLLGTVRSALQGSGLPPECLKLEITESLMIQSPERVQEILLGLRQMGVQVMLDDFGTGYSNLSLLRNIPVSGLKIDRSFVTALERGENASAQAMIRAIVQLSEALGLDTVAEGVEHAEEHQLLRDLGVTLLQGYHFAPPSATWNPEPHCPSGVVAAV
ncbi:EAL domain-containing protein [Deinococcus ficus]|nr:EAL domain-containing protein [Deinococcus ficus]